MPKTPEIHPGLSLTQPDFHTNFNVTMKKFLLLLFTVASFVAVQAQTCVRDSTVLTDTAAVIHPRPYSDTYQVYALAHACIGQPYLQSFTLAVPSSFTFQGITLPITSASIATSGALSGQPVGITYLCDPPNCVFNANTLGCILLYGTPTAANTPDTFSLVIAATIQTAFAPVPVTFPGPVAPGNYYLILDAAGSCVSSAYDLNSQIVGIKNQPNPFGQQTTIEVESVTTGDFQFEVFDLLGRRMHQQNIRLVEGTNQFTFDAGTLADGTYFYSLGNREGKVSKVMVIAR